jgi:hypothetical protein
MTLYSIYPDEKYRTPGFNDAQIREVFGDEIHQQFSVNFNPVPYSDKWQVLDVNFDDDGSGLEGDLIPEISVHYGRIYLSRLAYEALVDILSRDGEFLPIRVNGEEAYFFNPLKKAEDVDGLDKTLSIKNEWGDIEHTAFHQDRVKDFAIFKSDFDNCVSAYCREDVKEIVEEAGLKGVFFTEDLGNPLGS